jgi:Phosphotransferase enzyme family
VTTADRIDLPPDGVLLDGLHRILCPQGSGEIHLLARSPNRYASSAPSEFVTVGMDGQQLDTLFCKYDANCARPGTHDHRKGVGYESAVYRDLLAPRGVSVPRYVGSFAVGDRESECLVVAALRTAQSITRFTPPRIADTAAWLGRFHHQMRGIVETPAARILSCYDGENFTHWMQRLSDLVGEHDLAAPWLDEFSESFSRRASNLASCEPTVVHGEFFPENVLASDAGIHPIDWESAGIGAGEIDLACLTMGWPADTTDKLIREYVAARWPDGAPGDLHQDLDTARVYLALRMLGNNGPGSEVSFLDYLHRIGTESGLLSPGPMPREARHG